MLVCSLNLYFHIPWIIVFDLFGGHSETISRVYEQSADIIILQSFSLYYSSQSCMSCQVNYIFFLIVIFCCPRYCHYSVWFTQWYANMAFVLILPRSAFCHVQSFYAVVLLDLLLSGNVQPDCPRLRIVSCHLWRVISFIYLLAYLLTVGLFPYCQSLHSQ